MTYAMADALQVALYGVLSADPALAALVGDAIHDDLPPDGLTGTFVTLGTEDARDRSDKTGAGAEHRVVISVITDKPGFREAKAAAAVISDALTGALPALSRGRVVGIRFVSARARRAEKGAWRRIDMTFRARVEDD